ncbi:hypothetical protein C4K20_3546 [Pseudomonas chlororaphis subsp. aurantiaca]|nr:hypothetical protein C4K20_3546 [Pseudomonas chlororaphis subsp. aurantiaca]AZD67629.1 hypothetical protein C4K17_3744 [Pseudomonas chlororaphis subsp. aurantiaca]
MTAASASKRMSSVGFDSQTFAPLEHLYPRLKISMQNPHERTLIKQQK